MREIVICVFGLSVSCGWKGPFRECKYAEPGWTRGSPPLLNSSWPLPTCGVTPALFTSQTPNVRFAVVFTIASNLLFPLQIGVIRLRVPPTRWSAEKCTDVFIRSK